MCIPIAILLLVIPTAWLYGCYLLVHWLPQVTAIPSVVRAAWWVGLLHLPLLLYAIPPWRALLKSSLYNTGRLDPNPLERQLWICWSTACVLAVGFSVWLTPAPWWLLVVFALANAAALVAAARFWRSFTTAWDDS
ncbi:MAG TPA: hypothetical protein VKA32_01275 [Gammaproteobacteria bacterium]|nr:hypothetical protein [Gammaproteobacteria bacterium]